MTRQQRRWLKESLESILVPELERGGFVGVPLAPDETRGEVRRAFPFGRSVGKGAVDTNS